MLHRLCRKIIEREVMQKELDIYYDTTCWGCMTAMIGEIITNDDGYELFVGYCPECEPEE